MKQRLVSFCFVCLEISLLLGNCLDHGIVFYSVKFISFIFVLLLSSFSISVNALLTLMRPYVSGLVQINRSLTGGLNAVVCD